MCFSGLLTQRDPDPSRSQYSSYCHFQANQNSDWTFEDEKSSTYAITLSKSDLTVFISILEERKNYWFIHGSESSAIKEPSRMFTR